MLLTCSEESPADSPPLPLHARRWQKLHTGEVKEVRDRSLYIKCSHAEIRGAKDYFDKGSFAKVRKENVSRRQRKLRLYLSSRHISFGSVRFGSIMLSKDRPV